MVLEGGRGQDAGFIGTLTALPRGEIKHVGVLYVQPCRLHLIAFIRFIESILPSRDKETMVVVGSFYLL